MLFGKRVVSLLPHGFSLAFELNLLKVFNKFLWSIDGHNYIEDFHLSPFEGAKCVKCHGF